jgi:hypothetical protein
MLIRGLRGLLARSTAGRTLALSGVCCLLSIGSAIAQVDEQLYMTPTGDGLEDGSDWANAFAGADMATVLNTRMGAGDVLNVGGGTYNEIAMITSTSGTATAPKVVRGVLRNGVLPSFVGDWNRDATDPANGQFSIIGGTGSHWVFENMNLSGVQYGVRVSISATNLTLRDLRITNVRHGFFMINTDDLTIENCSVIGYKKHGFRLERACNRVTFRNCVADRIGTDPTWQNEPRGEAFPFGFILEDGGSSANANTVVKFYNCIARNNRWNDQWKWEMVNGVNTKVPLDYYNGDGFVTEHNNNGVEFYNCVSTGNDDGGFDLKSTASLYNCVSVRNYRGFRLWDSNKVLENCVAAYPWRRSTGNQTGTENGGGIWLEDSVTTADYFTWHGTAGVGVHEAVGGTLTLTNSILSFGNATNTFRSGNVIYGAGTVTYNTSAGTNPAYIAASSSWDGLENDMDSGFYGTSKGYNSALAKIGGVVSFSLTDATNALAAGDLVGAVPAENWRSSTAASPSSFSNLLNHAGVATTIDVALANTPYAYTNNTTTVTDPNMTDDAKLMRTYRGTTTTSVSTVTVTQVPYKSYDVFVYWGGQTPLEAVPAVMNVEFQPQVGGTYTTSATKYIRDADRVWDGVFNESVAASAGTAVDGKEYVVFRNVTAPAFRIRATGNIRLGISGFQVAEN